MQILENRKKVLSQTKAPSLPAKFVRGSETFVVSSVQNESTQPFEANAAYHAYLAEVEQAKAKAAEFAARLHNRMI